MRFKSLVILYDLPQSRRSRAVVTVKLGHTIPSSVRLWVMEPADENLDILDGTLRYIVCHASSEACAQRDGDAWLYLHVPPRGTLRTSRLICQRS
jgi:hypothetical protein